MLSSSRWLPNHEGVVPHPLWPHCHWHLPPWRGQLGFSLPSWNKHVPTPWVCLKIVFPFLKPGYVSVPWRGIYILYSFLTSQLRVWNFMEHKTIFGPIMKTFKGHMESCCLPVTCLRDSEDPKITSPKPGAMLPYCFLFQYFECISFPGAWASKRTAPNATHGGIYFGHTKLQRLELRHSQSWRKGAAAWVHWIQIVPVDWHIVWIYIYICIYM